MAYRPPRMDNLRQLRDDAGLSQQALADAAGVGVRTIRRLEAGGHNVTADVLLRIADALDVQLDDIDWSTRYERNRTG